MAKDVVRIKTGVALNAIYHAKRERTVEIPRTEWDDMDQDERTARLDEIQQETVDNETSAWAFVDKEG